MWGNAALKFSAEIGALLFRASGDHRALEFLRQRVSLAVARGNARLLLASLPPDDEMDELAYIL